MKDDHGSFPAWLERVATLRGVAIVYVAYGVLHALVTRIPGPALALDDVKLNVVTQSLQAGYLPGNPPLYEWLLIAAQQIAGPSLLAVLLVKYFLIGASGVFAYLLANEVMRDDRWAALTSLSLILLYQFGWNAHQAFTHTLTLIPATLLFWWALLRLFDRRKLTDYLFLGAAVGIGLLSKYSFVGIALAAFLAAMLRAESRRLVLSPWMVISLVIAAIIASPHFSWLMAQNSGVIQASAERLQGSADPHWRRVVEGVPAALWAIASFFLPFAVIAATLFQQSFRQTDSANIKALIARDAMIIGAAGLLLGVIILGVSNLQERYAIAFLFPGLFWAMSKVKESAPAARNLSRYAAVVVVAAFLMFGLRVVQTAVPGEPFCSDCRQWIPYDAIADRLKDDGFEEGTLVAYTDHTAGNLRRLFPKARIISSHMPFYTPPGGRVEDKCYFIWSNELGPPEPTQLTAKFAADVRLAVVGDWSHPLRDTGWRKTTWTLVRVDNDRDLAKNLCRPSQPAEK